MKNLIKLSIILFLGLFLGACSPINEKNILEIASKDTPENFKIKSLEILDVEKHYDSNDNSVTDFNVNYHFESTQDRYIIEYVKADFKDPHTNVFFLKKIVSKGDVFECKLKGRYAFVEKYKEYGFELEGFYKFKPEGYTLDVLRTGEKITKVGDVSFKTKIHNGYNNKERKTVKLIEIGSKEEKDYIAKKQKL